MPATTPNGYPYVLPADHPLEYPALSQQLAQAIDLLHTKQGVVVPDTGWADLASSYTGLFCTRVASLVTVDCTLKRSGTGLAVTAGVDYQIGVIPTGFRPAHAVLATCVVSVAGTTVYNATRLRVDPTGAIAFGAPTTATFATGGWVAVAVTYRGA